jgi:hypothetical protein
MHDPVGASQIFHICGRVGVKLRYLELQYWWRIDGSAIFAIWACSCRTWLLPYVKAAALRSVIGTLLGNIGGEWRLVISLTRSVKGGRA